MVSKKSEQSVAQNNIQSDQSSFASRSKGVRLGAPTSVRIAGVEMLNKRIVVALTYIHGIGRVTAQSICRELKIDENTRVPDITPEQLVALRSHITKNYVVEGERRKQVVDSIKSLIGKGTYRGTRHRRGLPVHGQNTKNNAKTRKRRSKRN